ncbi:hypothetical protein D1872_289730 [compost metagenome]
MNRWFLLLKKAKPIGFGKIRRKYGRKQINIYSYRDFSYIGFQENLKIVLGVLWDTYHLIISNINIQKRIPLIIKCFLLTVIS